MDYSDGGGGKSWILIRPGRRAESHVPPSNTEAPPSNTEAPPSNIEASPSNTGASPSDTGASPSNTEAPPSMGRTSGSNTETSLSDGPFSASNTGISLFEGRTPLSEGRISPFNTRTPRSEPRALPHRGCPGTSGVGPYRVHQLAHPWFLDPLEPVSNVQAEDDWLHVDLRLVDGQHLAFLAAQRDGRCGFERQIGDGAD